MIEWCLIKFLLTRVNRRSKKKEVKTQPLGGPNTGQTSPLISVHEHSLRSQKKGRGEAAKTGRAGTQRKHYRCRSCQLEAATYRARTKPPLPALLASSCCGPCALQARPRSQGALRVGASWRRTPFAVRRCCSPRHFYRAYAESEALGGRRVNQRRGAECNHPVSRRPACARDVWRTLPCHPS